LQSVFLRSLGGAAEIDVIPDALVNEVHADFKHHVEQSGAHRKRAFPRQDKENQRGGGRTENAVADRLDDAPVMAFDVAH